MSDDNHAIVILSDLECSVCQQSWVQGFFSFASMSSLLPISCADTAVHGAANWTVEIIQVNQTKTLEPFPRLFILLRFTFFTEIVHSIALQTHTVIRELDKLVGLGVNYFCSWGKCAWKYVMICNNNMGLCVCPLERETS